VGLLCKDILSPRFYTVAGSGGEGLQQWGGDRCAGFPFDPDREVRHMLEGQLGPNFWTLPQEVPLRIQGFPVGGRLVDA